MSTTRPPLHLCIATGQNIANLIPALQCGAQEVWILQTQQMSTGPAGHLADALKRHGIAVQRIDFADDDVVTLNRQAEQIAERLDGKAVVINLSGGTKLMTLALTTTLAAQLETAPAHQHPHLVYTDTAHARLDWIRPVAVSEPMRDVLRLDDILFAQGFRRVSGSGGHAAAESERATDDRQRLTSYLGQHARELNKALGAINAISKQASLHNELQQELDFAPRPDRAFGKALGAARDAGLIDWDGSELVVFRSVEAARYLGGGWAEEFVAAKMRGMGFVDHVRGLEIEHVVSRTRNEIDAVAVHGNRMLLVECKAAGVRDEDVMDWIYKASQLTAAVGGSFAQALLVSARPFSEAQRRRAREYRIDVLAAGELAELPAYLRQWKEGGQPIGR